MLYIHFQHFPNSNLSHSSKIKMASKQTSCEPFDVKGDIPLARFGHTITLISKTKAILFGGATGDTGKYSITGDTY